MSAEEFVSGSRDKVIVQRIISIVESEAPITMDLLHKRLINSFSILREGSVIEAYINSHIDRLVLKGVLKLTDEEGVLVLRKDDETNIFRSMWGQSAQQSRYSYQVPPSEAACCIRAILEEDPTIKNRLDLLERFKSEMGWKRGGAQVVELFEKGLKMLDKSPF